jgi:hypothetical protein
LQHRLGEVREVDRLALVAPSLALRQGERVLEPVIRIEGIALT